MDETKETGGGFYWHQYWHRRKVWKDGFCKMHHPDTEKERMEKSRRLQEARFARSTESRLAVWIKRYRDFYAEVESAVSGDRPEDMYDILGKYDPDKKRRNDQRVNGCRDREGRRWASGLF